MTWLLKYMFVEILFKKYELLEDFFFKFLNELKMK